MNCVKNLNENTHINLLMKKLRKTLLFLIRLQKWVHASMQQKQSERRETVTTPNLVIDTNIVIKWFSFPNEEKVSEARKIYKQITEEIIQVYAPSFLTIELSNILFRKKHLPDKAIQEILKKVLNCGIIFI